MSTWSKWRNCYPYKPSVIQKQSLIVWFYCQGLGKNRIGRLVIRYFEKEANEQTFSNRNYAKVFVSCVNAYIIEKALNSDGDKMRYSVYDSLFPYDLKGPMSKWLWWKTWSSKICISPHWGWLSVAGFVFLKIAIIKCQIPRAPHTMWPWHFPQRDLSLPLKLDKLSTKKVIWFDITN